MTTTTAQENKLPPLIDRELFFGNPEISGAQISPDGKYISFIKPYNDVRNIWVKAADEPFDKAKPITDEKKRPIPGYFWSHDSKYILFVKDNDGDENFNVYAVNPRDADGKKIPAATNLTNAEKVQTAIYAVPRSEPDYIYIGINDRDKAWHDLYKVQISTGKKTLLRKNTDRISGWVFDNKDNLRLAARSAENGDTEILKVDGDKFTKIYSCSVFETCAPVRFHKDNKLVYMQTNKGNTNLIRLVLFDPESRKETIIESDPLNRVDFGSAAFSDITDELILTSYYDEKQRLYWKDKALEKDYELIKKQVGDREVSLGSNTKDEQKWIVSTFSDVDPGTVWLFDRKTKDLTKLYEVRDKLPRESLAQMKPITYKSSDGLEIPAYLTLPKGVAAKNLPLVVVPHGGPWARDVWGYNSFAQFLANRGYAVLQMNFRGSTGYGKKFIDASNNEWGQKMQDDITWGVKHLVSEGIADPKRVGIMGGSYGGYATLAGVTFTPDLYAAAVAIVAPSNLNTLLESIPPYWEQIRQLFYKRMGDPNTPEGKAQLDRQSPLFHVEKIKTPLMIVQGANDPRVTKREADQIVAALHDRNYPVEYILAEDEGHGFQRPVNNMVMFAVAEKFLAKHLGGRFQEGMKPEVAARLKEITIDPASVKVAEKIDLSAIPDPKPANPIAVGKSDFANRIEMGGKKLMEFTATEEIKKANDGKFIATSKASMPQGELSETTALNDKLQIVTRKIDQGGQVIEYTVQDGKAAGSMMNKPLSIDLGGNLFADGAGSFSVIATLPLEKGYTTKFRNLDVIKQRAEMKILKVAGTETIKVPAGEFETYKVEITSENSDADKQTVWIDRATRRVVKITSLLPQYGGAVMTSELLK